MNEVKLRSTWALEKPGEKFRGHWVVSGRFKVELDWCFYHSHVIDVVRVRYSGWSGKGAMIVRRYEIGLFEEKFFEVQRTPCSPVGRWTGWKRKGPNGKLVIDAEGNRVCGTA